MKLKRPTYNELLHANSDEDISIINWYEKARQRRGLVKIVVIPIAGVRKYKVADGISLPCKRRRHGYVETFMGWQLAGISNCRRVYRSLVTVRSSGRFKFSQTDYVADYVEFTSLSPQWFVRFKIKKACLTFAAHCHITVYIYLHSEILNF